MKGVKLTTGSGFRDYVERGAIPRVVESRRNYERNNRLSERREKRQKMK